MGVWIVSLLVFYLWHTDPAIAAYKNISTVPCTLRYKATGGISPCLKVNQQPNTCGLLSPQPNVVCTDPPGFICTKLSDEDTGVIYFVVGLASCSGQYISTNGKVRDFAGQLSMAPDDIVWTPKICLNYQFVSGEATADWTLSYKTNGGFKYLTIGNDGNLNVLDTKSSDCYTSNNMVSLYPNSIPKPDPCINDIFNTISKSIQYNPKTKRQTSQVLGRPLRLIIKAGGNRYLITRDRRANGTFKDNLSITTFCQECLSADSLFSYKGYGISGFDPQTSLPDNDEGFSLLHALSKQFLTTDVNSNLELNVDGGTKTGLTFQNADDLGEDFLSDYRHFLVYRRQDRDKNTVLYICPLLHRGSCMLPAANGALTLRPLNGTQTGSQPSFQDPSDASLTQLSDAALASFGGSKSPTFGIFERSPAVPVGMPNVVFIAIYVGYADGSDTAANSPLPFGSYYRVLSYNASLDALVFTTRAKAFQSPFRIMRQKWADPGSTAEYLSFQLTGSNAASTTASAGRYITRFSVVPIPYDSPGTASFGSVDTDVRLFNSMCCLCSQGQTDVSWIYYNGPGTTMVSLSASSNLTLTFRESSRSLTPDCQANAFIIRGA